MGSINLFSGGALLQLSVVRAGHHALHHELSIIIQLLVVVIPRLGAAASNEGAGRRRHKLTQYTRYLTIAPRDPPEHGHRGSGPHDEQRIDPDCSAAASGLLIHAGRSLFRIADHDGHHPRPPAPAVIMWLGELITEQAAVGNGMSRADLHERSPPSMPSQGSTILQDGAGGIIGFTLILAPGARPSWSSVVFVEQSPAPHPRAVCKAP